MKTAVPFEFTEIDRRAIARFLGYEGLATHIQCTAWAREQLRVSLNVMAQAKVRSDLPPALTSEGERL